MTFSQRWFLLFGLSLLLSAFAALAQDESTMLILPADAAGKAEEVTAGIVLPGEAADGMDTAEANHGETEANATDGLTEAQANAAAAAAEGLKTAMEAAEGARGDLGRANIPDGLPEQVPADLPAVPGDTLPGDVELPTPPAPPEPPIGG